MAKNTSKTLFGEDFEIENEFEDDNNFDDDGNDESTLENKDKIFGNSYNTGNIDFEILGKIKVHDDYDYFNPDFSDNSFETFGKDELQQNLYELFEQSPYFEKYSKIKRVPKNDMVKIYYYFAEPLRKRDKYTLVEIFIEICGFMNLNFKEMFYLLLPLDKQLIIKELDDTYDVLKRKKIKKLF